MCIWNLQSYTSLPEILHATLHGIDLEGWVRFSTVPPPPKCSQTAIHHSQTLVDYLHLSQKDAAGLHNADIRVMRVKFNLLFSGEAIVLFEPGRSPSPRCVQCPIGGLDNCIYRTEGCGLACASLGLGLARNFKFLAQPNLPTSPMWSSFYSLSQQHSDKVQQL